MRRVSSLPPHRQHIAFSIKVKIAIPSYNIETAHVNVKWCYLYDMRSDFKRQAQYTCQWKANDIVVCIWNYCLPLVSAEHLLLGNCQLLYTFIVSLSVPRDVVIYLLTETIYRKSKTPNRLGKELYGSCTYTCYILSFYLII